MNQIATSVVDDLVRQARSALGAQDWVGALAILARVPAPQRTADIQMDRAVALRVLGRVVEALEALEDVLVLEPRNFFALLSKGALLERQGQNTAAVATYKNAIAVAPPGDRVPAALARPFDHAKTVVARHAEALARHLRASVASIRAGFPEESLERFDEGLDIFAGLSRAYVQEPLLLHYPRLPAIPFYDRALFPWLSNLEAATPIIQAELAQAMATRDGDFSPYIAFPPGVPVDQWAELNHSPLWSTFYLWKDGVRQDLAATVCPQTVALLESLPMADQPGIAPTAVFSRLAPHTTIPAHTGSTNVRLLTHLPLVLPGPARFRVGGVTRPWRMGEAWVFDDSIDHQAWNDADETRVILIFDVWNPFLTQAERRLINAMMTASRAFSAL